MEPLISFVSLSAISFGPLCISSLIQSSIRPRLSLQTKKINSVNFFLLGDTWNVEKTNAIMRMMPDSGKPVYPYLASPPLLKNMEEGANYDNSGRSMRSTGKKMCGAV